MASVVISGDTSGAITLSAPAVAGTTTLTLPATSGTVLQSGTTVTEAQGGTGTTTGYYGFKNRIINGAMVIDQRNAGAAQTITGGASPLAFNCDRWQVRSAGSNATVQQVATNNTYRMVFTGLASNSAVAASQSIEALNCVDMAGQNVTLSLVAKSTSLTSLTLEAYYANTTNTFGTWGSPTVTSIGTQAVTISTTESTVSWTFAVPSAATTGIQIRITGGALLASQTLTIGNVQLEKGSTATSFDYRPYGTELALCQRYYSTAGAIRTVGASSSTAGVILEISIPVTLRGTPSFSGSVSQIRAYNATSISIASATYSVSGTYDNSVYIQVGSLSVTDNTVYWATLNSSSLSAEL